MQNPKYVLSWKELIPQATAEQIVGGLSDTDKMPWYSYSIPASTCITGAKLRKCPNSICAMCYALKGRYMFRNTREAMERRYKSLSNPKWIWAMTSLLRLKATRRRDADHAVSYFRWHDSGDLQGIWHLKAIVAVAENTKGLVRHWLPTRETQIVAKYLKDGGVFPNNLVVRLSGHYVDEKPEAILATTSTVHSSECPESFLKKTHVCTARLRGHTCGECRACWMPQVLNVSYPLIGKKKTWKSA